MSTVSSISNNQVSTSVQPTTNSYSTISKVAFAALLGVVAATLGVLYGGISFTAAIGIGLCPVAFILLTKIIIDRYQSNQVQQVEKAYELTDLDNAIFDNLLLKTDEEYKKSLINSLQFKKPSLFNIILTLSVMKDSLDTINSLDAISSEKYYQCLPLINAKIDNKKINNTSLFKTKSFGAFSKIVHDMLNFNIASNPETLLPIVKANCIEWIQLLDPILKQYYNEINERMESENRSFQQKLQGLGLSL